VGLSCHKRHYSPAAHFLPPKTMNKIIRNQKSNGLQEHLHYSHMTPCPLSIRLLWEDNSLTDINLPYDDAVQDLLAKISKDQPKFRIESYRVIHQNAEASIKYPQSKPYQHLTCFHTGKHPRHHTTQRRNNLIRQKN
jgi:hypothetical protein